MSGESDNLHNRINGSPLICLKSDISLFPSLRTSYLLIPEATKNWCLTTITYFVSAIMHMYVHRYVHNLLKYISQYVHN